jgi:hypothetical protein
MIRRSRQFTVHAILATLLVIANSAAAQKPNHGLFANDWKAKEFVKPVSVPFKGKIENKTLLQANIDYSKKLNKVSKYLSGINSTIYTGNYLEDTALINYLIRIKPGIIRFPGGDASNMYFWNGLPNDIPKEVLTFNGKWTDFSDGTADINWKMNTDRYYSLLEKTSSGGFITVNYPYARYSTSENPVARAAKLAADWVRYDKGRTKFWEIGNETYACWEGGFRIDTLLNKDNQPEYVNGRLYGQHFRIIADSMRAAAKQTGAEIFIGAMFSDSDDIWDGSEKGITKNWNNLLAPELRKPDGSNYADFITVHSYFLNKNEKTPLEIIDSYHVSEEIQKFIYKKLDNARVAHVPLALTEWNIKAPHQTTQVAALQAVSNICSMQELGFGAATYFSIKDHWRTDNGDFGMFANHDPLIKNSEPYPAFYHFYFLSQVLGDQMIEAKLNPEKNANVMCFASSFSSGGLGVIIVNKSNKTEAVKLNLSNFKMGKKIYWYELSKPEGSDDWSEKVEVNGQSNIQNAKGGPSANFDKIPAWSKPIKGGLSLEIKGLSVMYILVEEK